MSSRTKPRSSIAPGASRVPIAARWLRISAEWRAWQKRRYLKCEYCSDHLVRPNSLYSRFFKACVRASSFSLGTHFWKVSGVRPPVESGW